MTWRDRREYLETFAIALALYGVARLAGIEAPEWVRPYAMVFFGAVTAVFLVVGLWARQRR